MGVVSEAGSAYPSSGTTEIIPGFYWGSCSSF